MSRENKSKYALLGVLSLGSMSGYDLKKTIEYSIGHFWQENYAQIYPMLKQLERDGLASSSTEKQAGRPDRHIYTITERGLHELKLWLGEPFEVQVERNELLLKLFFGNLVQLPASIEHVQHFHDRQEQFLRAYEQTEADILRELGEDERLPYWLITLNYGKHIAQALRDWSEETMIILEKLSQDETAILSISKKEKEIW